MDNTYDSAVPADFGLDVCRDFAAGLWRLRMVLENSEEKRDPLMVLK
jgi:hypothetical protein